MFDRNLFRELDLEENITKFYYLRSLSRKDVLDKLCDFVNFSTEIKDMKVDEKLELLFSSQKIDISDIEKFINLEFNKQISERRRSSGELVKELNMVQDFNWGGSFGNSLERNIVNNYVKKISSYSELSKKIDNEIYGSMRGYTINSWYNHWSSILIEDIFKTHRGVLPTIGLIQKIDFFVNRIPFDLKVTYFPEELMKEKLKEKGFGVELTKVKEKCRELKIPINSTLKDRALNIQLQNSLSESIDPSAHEFLDYLNNLKKEIINDSMNNPDELICWLYEHQGESRFDAANRFFIILTDTKNIFESWKLKRNLPLLRREINKKIDELSSRGPRDLQFHWKKDNKDYNVQAEILFISK